MIFGFVIAYVVGAGFSLWTYSRLSGETPMPPPWSFAVAAAVAGALVFVINAPIALLLAALTPIMLMIGYVDALTLRIPNGFTAVAAVLVVLSAIISGFAGTHLTTLLIAAVVSTAVFVVLLFLNIFGLGMGDVKLAPVLTFSLALVVAETWPHGSTVALFPLFFAFIATLWLTIAFLLGGIWVLVRRPTKYFPFGPFLVAAWAITAGFAPAISAIAVDT